MKTKMMILAASAVIASAAPSHAATIASEDFEGGASGWSDNKTEDPGANTGGFTKHLGRFGQGAVVSKTFTLSGTQSFLDIAFDLYRIDTWDSEYFIATATDPLGNSKEFRTGPYLNSDGAANYVYGFPGSTDRIVPLSFIFNTTATSFTLTFSSTLNQDFSDESWGVDNLLITDDLTGVPGAVPEPSTWAMLILGFGVLGGALRRSRGASESLTYA